MSGEGTDPGLGERFVHHPVVHAARWHAGEAVHRSKLGAVRSTAFRRRGDANPADRRGPDRRTLHLDRRTLRLAPPAGATNPALTADDVTDVPGVDYVADPFLVCSGPDEWHLFFEIYDRHSEPTAVIGHATSADAGRSWQYDRVVLRDQYHLAYPYVFGHGDRYFMLPDRWNKCGTASTVLYETDALPGGWEPTAVIADPDHPLHDVVVFQWAGRWWAIGGDGGALYAYHSDSLTADGWAAHERNPVVTDRPEAGRPGGRPLVREDGIVLFLQDCQGGYGQRVRAFWIGKLTPSTYADEELRSSPVLEESRGPIGWDSGRMHHVDIRETGDGVVCAVDGNVGFGRRVFGRDHWAIGVYRG
jgi:hypothetical protein